MDAVVLAGGFATRLWPITQHRPKMFLPIGEMTIVDRIFEDLEDDDRINRVFVSTNDAFAEEFQRYLADAEFEKPHLSVEETTCEGEKLGVVGALAQLVDREAIDDDLLVVAGDNFISFDLANFVDTFERRDAPTLAAYDVGSRERATSYGVLELDGERVVGFAEKPAEPESTLVSIACYAFPAETIRLFDTYLENGNNPDEPGWFVQWLQQREPTYTFSFDGAWFDIGTPGSYLEAVAYHLEGDSRVAPGVTVQNSTIGENVHVMSGAEIVDATLEDTVVFPDASITGSSVENSIVDEEAVISGVDVAGTLVSSDTEIATSD